MTRLRAGGVVESGSGARELARHAAFGDLTDQLWLGARADGHVPEEEPAAAACGGDREDEDPVGDRGDERVGACACERLRQVARRWRSQRHGLTLVVGLRLRVGGLLDGLLDPLGENHVVDQVGQDLVEEAERLRQDRLPPLEDLARTERWLHRFSLTTDSLQS